MNQETKKVIEYWRTSLVDAGRLSLSERDILEFGQEVNFKDLSKGRLDIDVFKKLSKKRKEKKELSNEFLKVLICPLVFSKTGKSKSVAKLIRPIYIPAIIRNSGELHTPNVATPWIPRTILEPLVDENSVAIGELDEFNNFILKNKLPSKSDWGTYYNYSNKLLKSVSGEDFSDFDIADFNREDYSLVILDNFSLGSNTHLIRFCADILRADKCSDLLMNLAGPRT